MKIIKHGDVPKAKATCPVCGCEFEYDITDTEPSYRSTAIGSVVRCPDCGNEIQALIGYLTTNSVSV